MEPYTRPAPTAENRSTCSGVSGQGRSGRWQAAAGAGGRVQAANPLRRAGTHPRGRSHLGKRRSPAVGLHCSCCWWHWGWLLLLSVSILPVQFTTKSRDELGLGADGGRQRPGVATGAAAGADGRPYRGWNSDSQGEGDAGLGSPREAAARA